jgi:hypothetical protein
MARPLFRRFWIKILPNGSAVSQFDPFTGKSQEIGSYNTPCAQILFYPMSSSLAQKIRSNGDTAEASNLPLLTFDIPPDGTFKFERIGTLRLDLRTICGYCELEYSADLPECPRCLAKDQWLCVACGKLISNPIVSLQLQGAEGIPKWIQIVPALKGFEGEIIHNLPGKWGLKTVQVRCPECEKTIPRGLKLHKCTANCYEEHLYTRYNLIIDGKKHIILDYKIMAGDRH